MTLPWKFQTKHVFGSLCFLLRFETKGWIAAKFFVSGLESVKCKIEERINLKFLVKLNKTASEFFQTITKVYEEECMSRAYIFDWHKRFHKGQTDVEDEEHSGHPSNQKSLKIFKKLKRLLKTIGSALD